MLINTLQTFVITRITMLTYYILNFVPSIDNKSFTPYHTRIWTSSELWLIITTSEGNERKLSCMLFWLFKETTVASLRDKQRFNHFFLTSNSSWTIVHSPQGKSQRVKIINRPQEIYVNDLKSCSNYSLSISNQVQTLMIRANMCQIYIEIFSPFFLFVFDKVQQRRAVRSIQV